MRDERNERDERDGVNGASREPSYIKIYIRQNITLADGVASLFRADWLLLPARLVTPTSRLVGGV